MKVSLRTTTTSVIFVIFNDIYRSTPAKLYIENEFTVTRKSDARVGNVFK